MLDEVIVEVLRVLESGGRHPVLVGPHDSGKSAVVRAIAAGIAAGARPVGAQSLWRISMRAIDLATHKEGTLVAALSQVVHEAAASKRRPILWVPDVHLARVFDVHALLALLLERSGVRMIGEALPPFDRQCLDDVELANALHPLRMPTATEEQTRALLMAWRDWLRANGRVVRRAAMERALVMSRGAFANRALPGRAFRALSLALEATDPEVPLTAAAVTRALTRTVDVPPAIGDADPRVLRAELARQVVGQDRAIDALCARYALWRAGAVRRQRPAALVLLAGPPGVGKSHIARSFARATLGHEEHLVTIHGGDFAEDWKVDQLLGQIGASSHELRRGSLASALGGAPVSVVLIDELERSNPLLLRWVLQIADTGAYVTGSNELVSLENTFVIITSNVGADSYRDRPVGIGPEPDQARREQSLRRALASNFPPELFERSDALVFCQPLTIEAKIELANRWVREAISQVGERSRAAVAIAGQDAAVRSMAERSSDARVLRLLVEHELLAPTIAGRGAVRARVSEGRVVLEEVGQEAP
jgi:ATP-dependent Clp protease ATP-binding subunit ClpA